ncbi:VOC family protein [Algoriphagus yeomjeoni]|uniref:Catechol 2,3-dioxygenase-like lactoylglutathione lyase family enzyme n=1 Tax=Algoriphagus yeomjeoni TaxID=291403 RepID=A0A327PD38_9BACT|nr:hypothetical protein [Algoriphagus yeomjeoni]RAI90115.1 catechol 2,3-dioxygenase-like lactoylglutathione lyase family enzyme [Algoriphagus yeomjeoni]
MTFNYEQQVTKISVSDMVKSLTFYRDILGYEVEDKYTINAGGSYEKNSYIQMNLNVDEGLKSTIGLFVDIEKPFDPPPDSGTVPSLIVSDIKKGLEYLQCKNVAIDPVSDEEFIIENISDEGYVDRFFFFRDPDNNSLVMRQNLKEKEK